MCTDLGYYLDNLSLNIYAGARFTKHSHQKEKGVTETIGKFGASYNDPSAGIGVF